jgi:hypothetical protein
MMITPVDMNNIETPATPAFFFVSDIYTANEMYDTILTQCWESNLLFGAIIPLNSTGNIQPESVLQFYRGDSAAVLLQGYDNAKELPGSPNLVPNPPFPPNVNADAWGCLNRTIGASIPLMHGGGDMPPWGLAICILSAILLILSPLRLQLRDILVH